MIGRVLLVLLTGFWGAQVCAQELSGAELQSMLKKVEQMRSHLKISASRSTACDTPAGTNCTFESYCDKFAAKATDFYLYQDSEGRQVPNFQMLTYMTFADYCVGSPFAQPAVLDPFADPELLFNEQKAGGKDKLRQNKERVQQEVARSKVIFAEAQQRIIKFLQSRRDSKNGAGIDNMIARIKSVRFQVPRLDGDYVELVEDGCETPNAFFQPSNSSITICPQMMNMPDASLFSTMVHEFGHAIDSCSMAFENSKQGRILPEWMDGMTSPAPAVRAGVSPAKNPFHSVLTCLQSKESLGVKVPAKKDLLSKVDMDIASLRGEMSSEEMGGGEEGEQFTDAAEAIFDEQKKNISSHYDNFKHCSSFSGSGHMQEAFSDWLSSQVLADKIATIPESAKAREYAFASQAVFYGTGCENVSQVALNKVDASMGDKCQPLANLKDYLTSGDAEILEASHPKNSGRINRVIYAKAELRKALGCSGGENAKECK